MNTISWMMAGGLASETGEDRRQREHRLALREASSRHDGPGTGTALRSGVSAIAIWFGALLAPAAVDSGQCCAAA